MRWFSSRWGWPIDWRMCGPAARRGGTRTRRRASAATDPASAAAETVSSGRRRCGVMATEVLVYADLQGTPHLVGRLWARMRNERESATFEYDKQWLAYSGCFSLEPALKLGPGPFHTTS